MDELRVFISYTQDDRSIATALESLFNEVLGPAVHVFRDETCIGYGDDIRDEIVHELERADVLVAIIAGGQPASALSWMGYEIGFFEAASKTKQVEGEPVKNRSRKSVIGQVIILCNEGVTLGPQTGKRPVNLGIPTDILSEPETEQQRARFRGEAQGHTELLDLVEDMEELVQDGRHKDFFKKRKKGPDVLVIDFKEKAFRALKGRVRHVSKPTKQLVIRFSGAAPRGDYLRLPDEAKLVFSGQASLVFGLPEDDPSLFRKVEEPPAVVVRYETTWVEFKDSVKHHRYGAYWLDVIEQAVFGAKKGGAALDTNLVLVADNDQRHRVVVTTVTTFFNHDSEVSLYFIEALQRRDFGAEKTSNLLNGITIVCRFRFAFLEFNGVFQLSTGSWSASIKTISAW